MATIAPASAPSIALDARRLPRTLPWYLEVWVQMLRRKPLGTLGAAIVVGMLFLAVFADVLSPYGFAETNLRARFVSSSAAHWLGTDQIGRDVATRILYGARISLYVGFGAVAIASVIATLLGIFSAYWGGRLDLMLQRLVDAWMAFPGLLILMSIMSLLGPSVLNITLVLGIAAGIRESRIVRGVALSIREHVHRERTRHGLGPPASDARAHPAQRAAHHHRGGDDGALDRDPDRGEPVVPGSGRPAAASDLGRHALARWPRPHVSCPVARHLARGGPVARRLRLQHARRRAPRSPRPPAEGRVARGRPDRQPPPRRRGRLRTRRTRGSA
jgi:hypothetical protein